MLTDRSFWVLFGLTFAACTPYDPNLGGTPFLCSTMEPRCPDGYACMQTSPGMSVCTNITTAKVDATSDGSASGTCTMPFTGVLATWDLAGQPGSQASTTAKSAATGVAAGIVARSATLTSAAGTNSISASGWPSAASVDPQSYFTFGLAPPAGCALAIVSIALDVKASNTGPTTATLATSHDSFVQQAAVSTVGPGSVTISANATGMLEVRLYGYSATAATGTMRIQNQLVVTGKLE